MLGGLSSQFGLGAVITLKDQFSQTANRVGGKMTQLAQGSSAMAAAVEKSLGRMKLGFSLLGAGTALIAGMAGLVAATFEGQEALAALSSLGVEDLEAVRRKALQFSNDFSGLSAPSIIRSAYDIQSAISTLSPDELAEFASISALTAKATKASADEMVLLFTTASDVYSSFRKEVGNIEFAQQLSGATAATVQGFRTTGRQLSDALKNLGKEASLANVPLAEQFAILGALQASMPGAEAGTGYKALMTTISRGAKELGVEATNAEGHLLAMPDILDKIRAKFPDIANQDVSDRLREAFGSEEAVKAIKNLLEQSETLRDSTEAIEASMKGGSALTLKMARALDAGIGEQFALVGQQFMNFLANIGGNLLPVAEPFVSVLQAAVLAAQALAERFPKLTQTILILAAAFGATLVGVGALLAIYGALGLVIPLVSSALASMGVIAAGTTVALGPLLAGLGAIVAVVAAVIGAAYLLSRAYTSNLGGIRDAVEGVWGRVQAVWAGLKEVFGSITDGVGTLSEETYAKLGESGMLGIFLGLVKVAYRVRQFVVGMFGAIRTALAEAKGLLAPAFAEWRAAVVQVFEALLPIWVALEPLRRALGRLMGDGDSAASVGRFIGRVLGAVAVIVAQNLTTSLKAAAWVIENVLVPAFQLVGFVVQNFVMPIVEGIVGTVGRALDAVKGLIVTAVDYLGSLVDNLPAWMVPDRLTEGLLAARRAVKGLRAEEEQRRSEGTGLDFGVPSAPVVTSLGSGPAASGEARNREALAESRANVAQVVGAAAARASQESAAAGGRDRPLVIEDRTETRVYLDGREISAAVDRHNRSRAAKTMD
ncbi:MAG: phage tail tape measure protein [Sumerlaeia bacterium]